MKSYLVLLVTVWLLSGCLSAPSGGDTGTSVTYTEVEPNNYTSTANAVAAPSIQTGHVDPATDTWDVFSVTAAVDTTYTFTLSGFGSSGLYVTTQDSVNGDLFSSDPSAETITLSVPAGTVVYVGASATIASAASDYSLAIEAVETGGGGGGGGGGSTELHINTTLLDEQEWPRVAMSATGEFVAIWQSQSQGGVDNKLNLYGQRFDNTGAKVGGEFMINANMNFGTLGDLKYALDMNDAGQFCVAWGADEVGGKGAYARCYNSAGTDVSGLITVDTTSDAWTVPEVAIAMDNSGGFVVAYQFESGFTTGIKARRYSSSFVGGTAYWVDDQGGGSRDNDIRMDMAENTGQYVVSWRINDIDYKSKAVVVSAADAVGTSWLVEDLLDPLEQNMEVAAAPDGSFALIWESYDKTTYDSTLKYQRYNSAGSATSAVTNVAYAAGSDQAFPRASIQNHTAGNRLVIVWEEDSATTDWTEVYKTTLDMSNGSVIEAPAIMNTYTAYKQEQPAVATSTSASIIVWEDWKQEDVIDATYNNGVYGVLN